MNNIKEIFFNETEKTFKNEKVKGFFVVLKLEDGAQIITEGEHNPEEFSEVICDFIVRNYPGSSIKVFLQQVGLLKRSFRLAKIIRFFKKANRK